MISIAWIIVWVIMFVFVTVGSIVAFLIVSRMKWPLSYVVFENVGGKGYVISKKGKCRLMGFGDGGAEIFYLKQAKKYKAAYARRIGNKQIAWAIGEDGFWYNVELGDVNKKLHELGVMPVDKEMTYTTAAIRKGIDKQYQQKTFLEKWGVPITLFMLFMCIVAFGGVLYFTFSQQAKITAANAEAMKTAEQVMATAQQILGKVDQIKSGGSGIIPSVPGVPNVV